MQNTPELHTERLRLRRFTLEDTESFFLLMSDPEVNTFLPWYPLTTVEETKAYLMAHYMQGYQRPEGFHYAICLKPDNIPIGYVNVADNESHDFGYGLRKEYWHQGIVTEACHAVVARLKMTKIPYITATHDVRNPRSGKIMQKLGMTYQYTYQEQWQPKNIPVMFRMYQLNLDGRSGRVYWKYWEQHDVHYVEKDT